VGVRDGAIVCREVGDSFGDTVKRGVGESESVTDIDGVPSYDELLDRLVEQLLNGELDSKKLLEAAIDFEVVFGRCIS